MSPEHVVRYVDAFAGRQNARALNTADQMAEMVQNSEGRRLKYFDLIDRGNGR